MAVGGGHTVPGLHRTAAVPGVCKDSRTGRIQPGLNDQGAMAAVNARQMAHARHFDVRSAILSAMPYQGVTLFQ